MFSSVMDARHHQELQDVLAHHVVPCLKLRDAQALSQTCTRLRKLVHTGLPAATWTSLARRTFSPAHPILAVNSSQTQSEVAQLAHFHASVRSGKPVSTSQACILEAKADYGFDSPAYLSHSGKLFLCQQAMEIRLYSLSLAGTSGGAPVQDAAPMASLIFSRPTLEHSNEAELIDCSFTWSSDDSWVAIWYNIRDSSDPRAQFNANCFFSVIYVFDLATKEVSSVMHTKDIETLERVLISPNSKLLFLAWRTFTINGISVDIYDRGQRRLTSSVLDKDGGTELLSLSPSSKYFAMPHAADVTVYCADGTLQAVLWSEMPAHKHSPLAAWSPDESQLAYWSPGSPSTLCIFETQQWLLVRSIALEELDALEADACLLWSFYGLMPLVWSCDEHAPGSVLMPSELADTSPYRAIAKIKGVRGSMRGISLPAISADGAFVAVAVLDAGQYHVHVLDVVGGGCIFSSLILPGAGDEGTRVDLTLAWAGRRLLVQRHAENVNGLRGTLTVITF